MKEKSKSKSKVFKSHDAQPLKGLEQELFFILFRKLAEKSHNIIHISLFYEADMYIECKSYTPISICLNIDTLKALTIVDATLLYCANVWHFFFILKP
jgi:hypothetical protein